MPVGVSSKTITLMPVANPNRQTPAVAQLNVLPGAGYTVGAFNTASITIYPSQTPAGTGLTGNYYTNASATYSSAANFNPANFRFSRLDTNVDFTFNTTNNSNSVINVCIKSDIQECPLHPLIRLRRC